MSNSLSEAERFVRDIRGAAASILWILMITGRSLNNEQLCQATGYSDKSVKDGVGRLAGYDLIQDNGRPYGWSVKKQLPLPFRELWQGHHGKYLMDGDMETTDAQTGQTQESARSQNQGTQDAPVAGAGSQDTQPSEVFPAATHPRSEFPISEIGNSDLAPYDHDHDLIDCLDPQNAQINQSINHGPPEIGISDLASLMHRLGIKGRVYDEFSARSVSPTILLAWHWYTSCQTWLNRNPLGYAVKLLRQGNLPPGEWPALVVWWHGLEGEDRVDAVAHLVGQANGRLLHLPPANGRDLAGYLRADGFDELPETAVLTALVQLHRCAPEELTL